MTEKKEFKQSLFNIFRRNTILMHRLWLVFLFGILTSILSLILFNSISLNKFADTMQTLFSSRIMTITKHLDKELKDVHIIALHRISPSGKITRSSSKLLQGMNLKNTRLFQKAVNIRNNHIRLLYYPSLNDGRLRIHLVKRYRNEYRIAVFDRNSFYPLIGNAFLVTIRNKYNVCIYSSNPDLLGKTIPTATITTLLGNPYLSTTRLLPGFPEGNITVFQNITWELLFLVILTLSFTTILIIFFKKNRQLQQNTERINAEFTNLAALISRFSKIPLSGHSLISRSEEIKNYAIQMQNDINPSDNQYHEIQGLLDILSGLADNLRLYTEKTECDAKVLQERLTERESLLKEIHHRVKNNMQIIISLLSLQLNKSMNSEIHQMLQESISRVQSMSLVHEILYRHDDLGAVDMKELIQSLSEKLVMLFHESGRTILVEYNNDVPRLPLEKAIPCALIINELLSNAMKHAFNQTVKGTVKINFIHDGDNQYILTITDNGSGLPAGFDISRMNTLGLQLVATLSRQLKGGLNHSVHQGTEFRVTFPD